jgi:hypothetical protein
MRFSTNLLPSKTFCEELCLDSCCACLGLLFLTACLPVHLLPSGRCVHARVSVCACVCGRARLCARVRVRLCVRVRLRVHLRVRVHV